jgi:hypothetical protein
LVLLDLPILPSSFENCSQCVFERYLLPVYNFSENMDWWKARHLKRSNEEGYIPSNYVQKEDGKPESHEYVP